MQHALRGLAGSRPVLAYVILAYLFSWSIGVPLALQAQGRFFGGLPYALHYLFSFGPLAAALVVSALVGGAGQVRRLLAGLMPTRAVATPLLIAAAVPLASFGAACAAGWIASGASPDLSRLGEVDYLPAPGWAGALAL